MDKDNPLVRMFREKKSNLLFGDSTILYSKGKKFTEIIANEDLNNLLRDALYQMEIFDATACIPSYFRDELLGILFLGKKHDGTEFERDELDFFMALASDVAMAIRNAQLFEELVAELEKKKKLFFHTTVALAAAIDAKDHYTHGHTNRVTNISMEICQKLNMKHRNMLTEKFLEDVHIASLLHDIGKIGIPESILNKPGALTEEEFKIIKEHPGIGENILRSIKELDNALLGVKYHHEKFDGTGYPAGLKGDEIPLIAAIICAADAYDAMVSERPYRKGLPKEKAIAEIINLAGKQFHPEISGIMQELYQEGRI
jgi:HD-GYP domain-containing protein (c-di-GMP phosphodiesterase class II)